MGRDRELQVSRSGRSAHAEPDPAALAVPAPSAEVLELRRRLEESQARFRNIIQRTTDGIIVVGADGGVRFVNPAAEALFGRNATELVGEVFGYPLIGAETTELDIVRPGGAEPVVVELRATSTQWNDEPAHLLSLRDITDRKKAEQRARHLLLEQAAREQAEAAGRRSGFLAEASAALDASLDLPITLGALARLLVPRFADWCLVALLERGELRTVAAAHADPARQALLEALQLVRTDTPDQLGFLAGDARLLQQLGDSDLHALAGTAERARRLLDIGTRSIVTAPLHSRGNRLGVLIVGCGQKAFDEDDVDVMGEVAARAGRAIDNARLYHAALTASKAKSNFLGIISHELRTPLNAIMGYTEMLLSGMLGPVPEPQLAKLRRVDASAHHLLQIIEEILAYARLEAGRDELRPQPFTLGELVDGIVAVAEPLVRAKGLEFDLIVDDRRATAHTDVLKLRQVALNLLSNAVKFTEQGRVVLRARIEADELMLEVSDTGVGIAPHHQDAIFEPFWQVEQPLRRHVDGTGLGLSVARRLTEKLGGNVRLESTVGAGSTFTVRVPAHVAG